MDPIQFRRPSRDLGQVGYNPALLGLLNAKNEGRDVSWKHVLGPPAGTSSYHTRAVQGFIAEFVDLYFILSLQRYMGHGCITLESGENEGRNNYDLEQE